MAKGPDYEREICRRLSLWFSGGKDDDLLWRTANSGGRATVRGRKGRRTAGHCGDIAATCEEGRPLTDLITWEIKKGYSNRTFAELLDKPARAKRHVYEEWFEKCEAARKRAGTLYWSLIHCRDRKEPLIFLPDPLVEVLVDRGMAVPFRRGFLQDGDLRVVVYRLEDFLAEVKPDWIRQEAERWNAQRKTGS